MKYLLLDTHLDLFLEWYILCNNKHHWLQVRRKSRIFLGNFHNCIRRKSELRYTASHKNRKWRNARHTFRKVGQWRRRLVFGKKSSPDDVLPWFFSTLRIENFFSGNQSGQQPNSGKPQRFHEFFNFENSERFFPKNLFGKFCWYSAKIGTRILGHFWKKKISNPFFRIFFFFLIFC